jgi:hypothetical protein
VPPTRSQDWQRDLLTERSNAARSMSNDSRDTSPDELSVGSATSPREGDSRLLALERQFNAISAELLALERLRHDQKRYQSSATQAPEQSTMEPCGGAAKFKKYAILAGVNEPKKSCHGVRKARAEVAAYADCTESQMMAMFGWTDPKICRLTTSPRRTGKARHERHGEDRGVRRKPIAR